MINLFADVQTTREKYNGEKNTGMFSARGKISNLTTWLWLYPDSLDICSILLFFFNSCFVLFRDWSLTSWTGCPSQDQYREENTCSTHSPSSCKVTVKVRLLSIITLQHFIRKLIFLNLQGNLGDFSICKIMEITVEADDELPVEWILLLWNK